MTAGALGPQGTSWGKKISVRGEKSRFVRKKSRFVGKKSRFVGKNLGSWGKKSRFVGKKARFVGGKNKKNRKLLSVRFRFANRNEMTGLSVGKPSTNYTKPNRGRALTCRLNFTTGLHLILRRPCFFKAGEAAARERVSLARAGASAAMGQPRWRAVGGWHTQTS